TAWVVKPTADYVVMPVVESVMAHPYIAAGTGVVATATAYATVPSFRDATNKRISATGKFIADHTPSLPNFRRHAKPKPEEEKKEKEKDLKEEKNANLNMEGPSSSSGSPKSTRSIT